MKKSKYQKINLNPIEIKGLKIPVAKMPKHGGEVLGFSKDSSISYLKGGENILNHTSDEVALLNRSFSTVETSHGIFPLFVRPQHKTLSNVKISEKETLEIIRLLNTNKVYNVWTRTSTKLCNLS